MARGLDARAIPVSDGYGIETQDHSSEQTGPPDLTDRARWTTWKGDAEINDGCGVLRAALEPGELGLAGIGTTRRHFNPGLTGSNGVEVTFVRNLQEATPNAAQRPDDDRVDPAEIRFITGMALQIGSFYGQIGSEQDRSIHRGVQVHFDWIANRGFDWWLVRTIMPDDRDRFPVWI